MVGGGVQLAEEHGGEVEGLRLDEQQSKVLFHFRTLLQNTCIYSCFFQFFCSTNAFFSCAESAKKATENCWTVAKKSPVLSTNCHFQTTRCFCTWGKPPKCAPTQKNSTCKVLQNIRRKFELIRTWCAVSFIGDKHQRNCFPPDHMLPTQSLISHETWFTR